LLKDLCHISSHKQEHHDTTSCHETLGNDIKKIALNTELGALHSNTQILRLLNINSKKFARKLNSIQFSYKKCIDNLH